MTLTLGTHTGGPHPGPSIQGTFPLHSTMMKTIRVTLEEIQCSLTSTLSTLNARRTEFRTRHQELILPVNSIQQHQLAVLDVGGQTFTTTCTQGTMFQAMLSLDSWLDDTFLDRDPTLFPYVLAYLRGHTRLLCGCPRIMRQRLFREARYYSIPGLMRHTTTVWPCLSLMVVSGSGDETAHDQRGTLHRYLYDPCNLCDSVGVPQALRSPVFFVSGDTRGFFFVTLGTPRDHRQRVWFSHDHRHLRHVLWLPRGADVVGITSRSATLCVVTRTPFMYRNRMSNVWMYRFSASRAQWVVSALPCIALRGGESIVSAFASKQDDYCRLMIIHGHGVDVLCNNGKWSTIVKPSVMLHHVVSWQGLFHCIGNDVCLVWHHPQQRWLTLPPLLFPIGPKMAFVHAGHKDMLLVACTASGRVQAFVRDGWVELPSMTSWPQGRPVLSVLPTTTDSRPLLQTR